MLGRRGGDHDNQYTGGKRQGANSTLAKRGSTSRAYILARLDFRRVGYDCSLATTPKTPRSRLPRASQETTPHQKACNIKAVVAPFR